MSNTERPTYGMVV